MNLSVKHITVRGAVDAKVMVAFIVVAVMIVVAYLFWPSADVEPIPSPTPAPIVGREPPPLERVEPAKTEEERGDSARDVIASLKKSAGAVDYAQAHAQAKAFEADERFPDAHLLYFFAARGGYGPAAFDLAQAYDPNHFQAKRGLMEEPDPIQAYRWYQTANTAGVQGVDVDLAQLRTWAESASAAGNAEADRLIMLWE